MAGSVVDPEGSELPEVSEPPNSPPTCCNARACWLSCTRSPGDASATVTSHDFNGLRALAEMTGPRFHRGIVLYTGTETIPFGANLYALPVDALWNT